MRKLLLISFCVCINSITISQTKEKEIPLFKFLQENFDSVVVWHSYNNWSYEPHYEIISKTNNEFSFFTYINPYNTFIGRAMPKSISEKFIKLSVQFMLQPPDTNQYFLPARIDYQKRDSLWSSIQKNDLWNLKDDKIDGEGCLTNNKKCAIFDADEHSFYLITKKSIKALYFYAPAYYNRCCPDRVSREKIIKIIHSFATVFNTNSSIFSPATVSSPN